MPTPTERLTTRKAMMDCRVCTWLASLEDKERREWQAAIVNTRFGSALVASEIAIEITNQDEDSRYDGYVPGESSVTIHRQRGHR